MIKRVVALTLSVGVRAFDIVVGAARRWRGGPIAPRGVVLYYHAVTSKQRQRFAMQMDELLSRARPFPAASPEAMREVGLNVAVTFDDGFASVVDNAVPALATRGIPFTMFAPTGCLGERPSWIRHPEHPSAQERVMTAAELRQLAASPLATIGSHSITHPNFLSLEAAVAERELVDSRWYLEGVLGTRVELFSFPHGAHNGRLLEQARRAGYRYVFTVEPEFVERDREIFAIGRVSVDPDDWWIEFRLKIAGAYRWRRHACPEPSTS